MRNAHLRVALRLDLALLSMKPNPRFIAGYQYRFARHLKGGTGVGIDANCGKPAVDQNCAV
jgi:hypothetical protein